MNGALLMRLGKRFTDLSHDAQCQFRIDRAGIHRTLQGDTFDVIHDDIVHTFIGFQTTHRL